MLSVPLRILQRCVLNPSSRRAAIAAALAAACACGQQSGASSHLQDTPAAPAPIEESFAVAAPSAPEEDVMIDSEGEFGPTHGSLIRLKKSALDQEFLLTPAIVMAGVAPMVEHLRPKIVTFALSGDEVALLEVNHNAIYDDLPSTKLLQTFPVVEETEDTLGFPWRYGLRAIPLTSPLGGVDIPGSLTDSLQSEELVLTPTSTFLRGAKLVDNAIEFEQLSRVQVGHLDLNLFAMLFGGGAKLYDADATLVVHTRLAPYHPDAAFEAKPSTEQKHLGFFEVARLRPHEASVDVLAARWNATPNHQPITYTISNKTPPEFIDAVREGIEYWNRVAQRDIVKAVVGPDAQAGAHPRQVMVHWIDWRDAGFAMSSLQPDPLTGEIINADIFLTNAFDYAGQMAARRAPSARPEKNAKTYQPVPGGFASARSCSLAAANQAPTMQALARASHDPKLIAKAAQDYVRLVVAHEVGHTLGLRHNFAGSLETELADPASRDATWKDYLSDVAHGGAVTASTVMDYSDGPDSVLLGEAIRQTALPYDQAAIGWLYGENTDIENGPAFCTDGDLFSSFFGSPLMGCSVFDSGRSPVASAARELAHHNSLADELVDSVLLAMRPLHAHDAVGPVEALGRLEWWWGGSLFNAAFSSAAQLMSDGRSLQVEEALGQTNWANEAEVREQTDAALCAASNQVGGLPGLLSAALPIAPGGELASGWLQRAVANRINSPGFETGETLEGVRYTLSGDELATLRKYIPIVSAKMEETYLQMILNALAPPTGNGMFGGGLGGLGGFGSWAPPHYASAVVDSSWQQPLGDLARTIVLDSEGVVQGEANGQALTLPKPTHRGATRVAAIGLLSDTLFSTQGWLRPVKEELVSVLTDRVSALATPENGAPISLSPALSAWLQEEQMVLQALQQSLGSTSQDGSQPAQ